MTQDQMQGIKIRRSFLAHALAGGAAAGTAYLGLTRDLYAPGGRPDRARPSLRADRRLRVLGLLARQGRQGRDRSSSTRRAASPAASSSSSPRTPNRIRAAGARKLRSLIQRNSASFIIGSVHSGVMLSSIPVATELKTIYFSAGEATEATGSKGTRYSFRTGTDTYGLAAAGAPWAYENLGKTWTIISPDYAWGHSHYQEHKAVIEKLGGKVIRPDLRAARRQGSRSLSRQDPAGHRGAVLGVLRRAVGRLLHAGQVDGAREDDADVFGLRHDRGDRSGRHSGRGRRRLRRREFPAHAEVQGRRVPPASTTS